MGRSAASWEPELSTGDSFVTHSSLTNVPGHPCASIRFVHGPMREISDSRWALSPVTILLTWYPRAGISITCRSRSSFRELRQEGIGPLRRPPVSRFRLTQSVAQHTQAGHLQFHDIARLQAPTRQLQRAAVADRPRTDDITGAKVIALGDVGEEFRRRPNHMPRVTDRPD